MQVYTGALSEWVMLMLGLPSQLSVEEAEAIPVTAVLASVAQLASRNTSASSNASNTGAEGAVSSSTVINWSQLVLAVLPQWSSAVAVNVRVKK